MGAGDLRTTDPLRPCRRRRPSGLVPITVSSEHGGHGVTWTFRLYRDSLVGSGKRRNPPLFLPHANRRSGTSLRQGRGIGCKVFRLLILVKGVKTSS